MPAATKKSPPMELEPGEGKAHESAESSAEETREGSEPDDAPKAQANRKRSAKGAKATKAPMDSDCGCGGKKGASCDGGCGGYAKKMDRNDALTPQEYLAACDLGIQGRSRSYIRARLDAAERLDKKCGASGIADNKKCRVNAGGAPSSLGSGTGGSALGNALKIAAVGAGVGLAAKAAHAAYQARERDLPLVKTKVGGKTVTIGKVRVSGAPGHDSVASAVAEELKKRRNKRAKARGFKRSDSVYAAGFSVDPASWGI